MGWKAVSDTIDKALVVQEIVLTEEAAAPWLDVGLNYDLAVYGWGDFSSLQWEGSLGRGDTFPLRGLDGLQIDLRECGGAVVSVPVHAVRPVVSGTNVKATCCVVARRRN